MSKIKRKQSWQKDFSEFLKKTAKKPFKWGTNDCIIFPARAAQSLTGFDFVALNTEEGRDYKSALEASKMLKTHFDDNIDNVFTYFLGDPCELPPSFARRGDVVTLEYENEIVGGVVDDSGRKIVCAGKDGLVRLPLTKAIRFWKVGS